MMSRFRWTKSLAADVLDVRQRAGLEVVDADHAVAAAQQLVAQVRAEEPGAAGDQAGGHGREIYRWSGSTRREDEFPTESRTPQALSGSTWPPSITSVWPVM